MIEIKQSNFTFKHFILIFPFGKISPKKKCFGPEPPSLQWKRGTIDSGACHFSPKGSPCFSEQSVKLKTQNPFFGMSNPKLRHL
jgi:hypothetical protein